MTRALLLGLAMLTAASAERTVHFDGPVRIGKNLWHAVAIGPPDSPVRVECSFTVLGGDTSVRAIVATRAEAERFRDGVNFRAAAETPYLPAGVLQHRITRPGDYLVIVDNRGPEAVAATVQVRVELFHADTTGVDARTLSPTRRRVVIAISVLFFVAVAGWSGVRLWSATRNNY